MKKKLKITELGWSYLTNGETEKMYMYIHVALTETFIQEEPC